MIRNLILLCLAIVFLGCTATASKATAQQPERNTVTSKEVPFPTDLTEYLVRLNGVRVIGSGVAAQITIRGQISMQQGANDPLYVLNGNPIGRDYSQIFSSVNPDDIAEVRVLKGGDETAMYGMRGAAGVIEITLKQ
ncbi:MAG: TonB-dependent receptor plug domain-containing protein [Bacteroidota bacterium]